MAITHRVGIHFRSLSLTDVPFDTILKSAEEVYAPHGIKFEFRSGMSMGLSDDEMKKYEQLDGTCHWTITEGEYKDLQAFGGNVPATEIIVYYVNRFSQKGILGCGGHLPGRPACIVAAKGSRWDTAHEVGHVLLTSAFIPVHDTDPKNLMHATSIPTDTPLLTGPQVTQIKKSPCCIRV